MGAKGTITSKINLKDGKALKFPRSHYEMEAKNERTAYTRVNRSYGLMNVEIDKMRSTITMDDYSNDAETLEESIMREINLNRDNNKEKRMADIAKYLPNHTFTREEVQKRAKTVLELLKITEAYAHCSEVYAKNSDNQIEKRDGNISQNDISPTNVVIYKDGSIRLIDFNKAIVVREVGEDGEKKPKTFVHLEKLDLTQKQESHYQPVKDTIINTFWAHYEMADPLKHSSLAAGVEIGEALKHHDYHMIMSLAYWSITGQRWTDKSNMTNEKLNQENISTYLINYSLENDLKKRCKDKTYGVAVGKVLDAMIREAIKPLGTYNKDEINKKKEELTKLLTVKSIPYRGIAGGTSDFEAISDYNESNESTATPQTSSLREEDPLRPELKKMIEMGTSYYVKRGEEDTAKKQASERMSKEYKVLTATNQDLENKVTTLERKNAVYGISLVIGGALGTGLSIPFLMYEIMRYIAH